MLFGLKNTSSCAYAALNLSILLSMSFQVLYELGKQLGGQVQLEYNLFAYRLFLECCYWHAQHDIESCYWPAQHDIGVPG